MESFRGFGSFSFFFLPNRPFFSFFFGCAR
jgi:hypothetical protein